MRDLLAAGSILTGVDVPSKKQLLENMAAHAAKVLGLQDHTIFDVLWEREHLGTTGVGRGIAIPHGRVPGLREVRGFFMRLQTPVAYEAVDDKPVDLIFMLLAPEDAGADHLHALATVSRSLRDPALCAQLRQAKDAGALSRLLMNADVAKAA